MKECFVFLSNTHAIVVLCDVLLLIVKIHKPPLATCRRGVGGEGVLDLGTGEAMVGRCVRKMIGGQCHYHEGCVSAYNNVYCRYQVSDLFMTSSIKVIFS